MNLSIEEDVKNLHLFDLIICTIHVFGKISREDYRKKDPVLEALKGPKG
jgi:hypothetical protein